MFAAYVLIKSVDGRIAATTLSPYTEELKGSEEEDEEDEAAATTGKEDKNDDELKSASELKLIWMLK